MIVARGRSSALWKPPGPLPLAAAGTAAVGVQVIVARLPHTPWPEVDGVLGFLLCLLPVAWLVWVLCSSPRPTSHVAIACVVALVVAFASARLGLPTVAVPFQVVAAAGLGIVLARQVAAAWWLATFAGVAILADSWSVFAGPTRRVVEQAPHMLDYLLVHFTPLGGPVAGLGLGMSDLVFLALFLTGSRMLGLNVKAGYAAMLGSFVVTVMLAVWWRPAVPALPLLSLAFLVINVPSWVVVVRRRWFGGGGSAVPE